MCLILRHLTAIREPVPIVGATFGVLDRRRPETTGEPDRSSSTEAVENPVEERVVRGRTIRSMRTGLAICTIAVRTSGRIVSPRIECPSGRGARERMYAPTGPARRRDMVPEGKGGPRVAHGGDTRDGMRQMDGLTMGNLSCGYFCTTLNANDAQTEELSYEIGAVSADVAIGGVRVNIIPKEGGNTFSGSAFGNFSNSGLQGDNLSRELLDLGLRTPDVVDSIWDSSVELGGPSRPGPAVVPRGVPQLGPQAAAGQHLLRQGPGRLRLRARRVAARRRRAVRPERQSAVDLAGDRPEQVRALLQRRPAAPPVSGDPGRT